MTGRMSGGAGGVGRIEGACFLEYRTFSAVSRMSQKLKFVLFFATNI